MRKWLNKLENKIHEKQEKKKKNEREKLIRDNPVLSILNPDTFIKTVDSMIVNAVNAETEKTLKKTKELDDLEKLEEAKRKLSRAREELANKSYAYNSKNNLISLPPEMLHKIISYSYFMDNKSPQKLSCVSKHLFWSRSVIKDEHKNVLSEIRRLVLQEALKSQSAKFALIPDEDVCQKIMQLKAKAGIPNEGPSSFFNGLNLSNLDLSGLDLSYFGGKDTSFANTNLKNCNLSHAEFSHGDFSNANLENCNLSNASMRGKFDGRLNANFKNACIHNLTIEKKAGYFSLTEGKWVETSWGPTCEYYEDIIERLRELGALNVETVRIEEQNSISNDNVASYRRVSPLLS